MRKQVQLKKLIITGLTDDRYEPEKIGFLVVAIPS